MIEHWIEDLGHSLGHWSYLLVGFMAFAETAAFAGFVAPGEFTVIFGGVLAGEGSLSIVLLIGIVWTAAVLGDTVGFMLGRRLGRGFIIKHGHYVRLSEERIQRVESYFGRHGGKTILIGRWIGFVRPLMPFTAGASQMPYRRFLPFDVLSAGAWSACFCLLGFIFWRSFSRLTKIVGRGALGLSIVAAILIIGVLLYRRLRDSEDRRKAAEWMQRQGRRPLLRPLAFVVERIWRFVLRPVWRLVLQPIGRLLNPPMRFLVNRVRPGDLGLDLTSLLAIGAVSGYLFGLYTNIVVDRMPAVTPGDRTARDIAIDSEHGFLTGLAKVVSFTGATGITAACLAVVAILLVRQRRVLEAVTTVFAYVAVVLGVHITKAAVDRPRPADALVDASGSSFPSGHAANSVVYLALSILIARQLGHNALRVATVVSAALLAAAIGLSRVYLRVHYLSDVVGGWTLALGVFSIAGAVALVISYLRKNDQAQTEEAASPYAKTPEPRAQHTS